MDDDTEARPNDGSMERFVAGPGRSCASSGVSRWMAFRIARPLSRAEGHGGES